MFNHTPSPAALHNMATRLSQIRFSAFSRATKKEPLKQSPRSTNPNQAAMASLQQIQHDRMAQQATKSQQAGTRRPHYQSHQPQNADWTRSGGSRDLQAPSSKDHYQDWHEQRDELMKSLPRRPKQRMPLNRLDADMEQRLEPRGLRQQSWAQKASGTPRPKARMSELSDLIDDYINWNQSSSDLGADPETDRPGTSGTLFVDFVENGDMEVSYRNGVNKKLPSPPLPPQIPTPASLSSLHRRFKAEQGSDSKVQCKCVSSLPSHTARHDSVVSSRTANADRIDPSLIPPAQPPPSRPLPLIPSQAPGPAPAPPRKSHPPQVHRTQRTSSQVAPARHASPAPSHASNASFHTARTSRNREAYVKIPSEDYNAPAPAPTFTATAAPPQKLSPSSPRKSKRHTRSKSTSTAAMPAHAQRAGAKRRSKVIAFVQKMLQKLEHLKELPQHHRRQRSEPVAEKPSWVKAGYVT
jgi:hypothetical protein